MQRQSAVTTTMAIMTASFYICWAPYGIKCILAMFGVNLTLAPSALVLLFAKLGVVVNPVIYIFCNKEVRVLQ